jgi:hypothetical protein
LSTGSKVEIGGYTDRQTDRHIDLLSLFLFKEESRLNIKASVWSCSPHNLYKETPLGTNGSAVFFNIIIIIIIITVLNSIPYYTILISLNYPNLEIGTN